VHALLAVTAVSVLVQVAQVVFLASNSRPAHACPSFGEQFGLVS